jgi:FkbM family methyltransferase
MRLNSIPGKITQLRRSHPSLWRAFLSGWIFRRQSQVVPCVVPGCRRLLKIPLQDFYDSYAVYYEQLRGREELDFFLKHLRPNEVLYDIGAHRGAFLAAVEMKLNDHVAAHAFDPVAGNIESIRQVCRLNGFDDVHINQQAVGRGNTLVGNMSSFDYMFRAGSSENSAGRTEFPTVSLDEYVGRGAAPPTLMKIDVEGFEGEVLAGGRGVLTKHRPRLWLEIHPVFLESQGASSEIVLELLREVGYTVSFHEDYHWPTAKTSFHVWCE